MWISRHCYGACVTPATTVTFWWNRTFCPAMGTPKESARRNREYLRSIESNFN